MRIPLPALLVVASFLAGCLDPTSAPPSTSVDDESAMLSWEELGASIYSDEHDHRDRGIHEAVARGLTVLNASALSENGLSLGEYTEADHAHGLIAVAIVTGAGSTMRIALLEEDALPGLDVVGYFDEPDSYGDVKFDDERPLLYVPYPGNDRAFSIWDISDVKNPRRLGQAAGSGCHMLHPLRIDGISHVFCAGLGGTYAYRIQYTPQGVEAVPVGLAVPQSDPEVARYATYYQDLSPLGPALISTPHDQTAQPDPLTGQPLLVTAHELQGIRVFDVSVPAAPKEISAWRGDGMNDYALERVHTVGLAKIDGRRIGFGATETFTDVEPALYIVDFTDWTNPKFLARWTPPGIVGDQGITYSLHNLQVVGTRLYLTNFHGGLWVLDVTDPANPITEALRTPVRDTEYPRPGEFMQIGEFQIFNNVNQYWDVIVVNGYTIVTDMSAGIEVFLVDGDPAGDPDWDGFT
jgi:hypothetical protein